MVENYNSKKNTAKELADKIWHGKPADICKDKDITAVIKCLLDQYSETELQRLNSEVVIDNIYTQIKQNMIIKYDNDKIKQIWEKIKDCCK